VQGNLRLAVVDVGVQRDEHAFEAADLPLVPRDRGRSALSAQLRAGEAESMTTSPAGTPLTWLARGEMDLPPGRNWLAAGEVAKLSGMRFTKRRTEYLLGRWTAKQALARSLGLAADPATLARIEVRNSAAGAPEAHLDGEKLRLAISLSHRAGWAACLVGAGPGRVGCDLELVEPRSPAFVADYLTDDEQRFVAAAPDDLARHLAATLVWSAKESALKVLQTGLRRTARSVPVVVDDEPRRGGWAPLTVSTGEVATLPGWWRRFGDFLLTVAADRPTAPPASLDEPPALAGAHSTHSWLAQPA
jgi:4'-phosphopantetheinyl transferase